MFGALAGSGALPFPVAAFEQAVRAGGKAVASNLAAFEAGSKAAVGEVERLVDTQLLPAPTTEMGRRLLGRIHEQLPEAAHEFATEGVRRLRSEEHTSELQSLMRISYAVFCLKKHIHKTN